VTPANVITAGEVSTLKAQILASSLTGPQLVRAAWASASTHRTTDYRGGANGGRIRLSPQKDWAVNDPAELATVLSTLEGIQAAWNGEQKNQVSMADLIVLGGTAAVEAAAVAGGNTVEVPFKAGRTDASAEQTDAKSFAVLEPKVDGFRNHLPCPVGQVHMLVDRAHLLGLTAPEMTVLVGGLRALNANTGGSSMGVLTATPGNLTNDFFVNLLDMDTTWSVSSENKNVYNCTDNKTNQLKWTASPVDLAFASNAELRAIAEFYAQNDNKARFAKDFVAAWTKVMQLDMY
jgi:catalase-peroxidase